MTKKTRRPRCPRGMEVQSVMFDRDKWTVAAAQKWLRDHDFTVPKVDTTANYLRFRQRPTFVFTKGSLKTKALGKSTGIQSVVGCPRPGKESDAKKNRSKNPKIEKLDDNRTLYKSKKSNKAAILIDNRNGTWDVELGTWEKGKFKKGHKDRLWFKSKTGAKYKIQKHLSETKSKLGAIAKAVFGNPRKAPARKAPRCPSSNPAIRLPDTLAYLGKAVKLTGPGFSFKWKRADEMILFTNAAGTALYLIRRPKEKPITSSKMVDARAAREPEVTRALGLYGRFHDFESLSGSVIDKPTGTVKTLGRAESIVYASDKWTGRTREYVHDFETPPVVKATNARSPAIVTITGGKIKVTTRGIEG